MKNLNQIATETKPPLSAIFAATQTRSGQRPNLVNGLTQFPTGESKRSGGFDTEWRVEKYRGWWIGSFLSPFSSDRLYIAIMPVESPWELAVDSFLDFIDRLREGRIPRDIEDPIALIDMCNWAARRQR